MVGLTHASSVIAPVRCNDALSATVTRELLPLKLSAWPYFPVAAHVVFAVVPVLPLPDASATVVPDPSSNPYAATRPGVAEVPMGTTTRPANTAAPTTTRNIAASFRATRARTTRSAPPVRITPRPLVPAAYRRRGSRSVQHPLASVNRPGPRAPSGSRRPSDCRRWSLAITCRETQLPALGQRSACSRTRRSRSVRSPRAELGADRAGLRRARDLGAARPRPLGHRRLLDRRRVARRDRREGRRLALHRAPALQGDAATQRARDRRDLRRARRRAERGHLARAHPRLRACPRQPPRDRARRDGRHGLLAALRRARDRARGRARGDRDVRGHAAGARARPDRARPCSARIRSAGR